MGKILILLLLALLGYLLIEEILKRNDSSKTLVKKEETPPDLIPALSQAVATVLKGEAINSALKMIVQQARALTVSDIAYLFLRDETSKIYFLRAFDAPSFKDSGFMSAEFQEDVLTKLMKAGASLVIDKGHSAADPYQEAFLKKLGVKNAFAIPVYAQDEPLGIFGIGTTPDDFLFRESQMRIVELLGREAALAFDYRRAKDRLAQMEIRDPLTGLYNKMYILGRLGEEIRRAVIRQRPCSFVLLNVDNFQRFRTQFGVQDADERLKQMASLIRSLVSEIDPVAKFGDNEFAIVLPERNKRQAHEETEEIRKIIERTFAKEQDSKRRLTVSGGISENPLDGVNAEELVTGAQQLLLLAKRGSKNTILV